MKRLTKQQRAVLVEAQNILTTQVRDEGVIANDPNAAISLARTTIALHGNEREHLLVMMLDSRHKLIESHVVFSGTVDACEVQPRIIAQQALLNNASAVILAHNHPSGYLEPSAADHAMTARVKQALALFDVRILDHFIVTAAGHTSFSARGWL